MTLLVLFACFTENIYSQNAWINEFHYDNINTDAGEFVEVVIENPASYSLASFSVVLYNGSSTVRTPYDTRTLNLFTVGTSYGNYTFYYFNYPVDGIQNGAPDGIALVYNSAVITSQFLSYEGSFVAASGPASGMTSVDIGVDEDGATPLGYSLQLSGTGVAYTDYTWQPEAASTQGTLNNGQSFNSVYVANPANFISTATSNTQVDLGWELNQNADSVFIAFNTSNTFGTPSGAYAEGDFIDNGGTILYKGTDILFNHTGLSSGNEYFYRAWSKNDDGIYSTGITDSASTQSLEPTFQPAGLLAACNGYDRVTVSWNDSDGDNYLVKGSSLGYSNIVPPLDGVTQGDSLLVKNVAASVQTHQFTGLIPSTTYYFKIWPYKGTGSAPNYKTNGTIPQSRATTNLLELQLLITEIADPRDSSLAKFVEITNSGDETVNFASSPVYLCRQSNGTTRSSVRLTGSVLPGNSHIVAYVFSSADTNRFTNAFGFEPDQYSTLVSGNGNDGYFLYYGGDHTLGYLFDAYGVENEDGTGESWEYTDKKAVRKRSITTPTPVWDPAEWVIPSTTTAAGDMTPGYHSGEVNWLGISSVNWNAKGNNWSSPHGFVPDASCNVIISGASFQPVVTAPAACNKVTIHTGNSLSVQSSGSLYVVGQE